MEWMDMEKDFQGTEMNKKGKMKSSDNLTTCTDTEIWGAYSFVFVCLF